MRAEGGGGRDDVYIYHDIFYSREKKKKKIYLFGTYSFIFFIFFIFVMYDMYVQYIHYFRARITVTNYDKNTPEDTQVPRNKKKKTPPHLRGGDRVIVMRIKR